ncbi:MAG: CsbD family protein [Desulfobacteria bacterium]
MVAWSVVARNWSHFQEVIRQKWDFLSEREVKEIAGDHDRLITKIEERYGLSRRRAERWVEDSLRPIV